MATLLLKSSRNEQRALIFFLWAKGLNANEIHSEMPPVYGDKCFPRPAIHVWCTKFAHSRESTVDKEQMTWPACRDDRCHDCRSWWFRTVRWDKCL